MIQTDTSPSHKDDKSNIDYYYIPTISWESSNAENPYYIEIEDNEDNDGQPIQIITNVSQSHEELHDL